MPNLFQTGNSEDDTLGVFTFEAPTVNWFVRAIAQAMSLMCDPDNWTLQGDASIDFATSQAVAMFESLELDVHLFNMPTGAIMMWHTATPPDGWLILDGASLATADFPNLFALWGYTFGGSGANFNLPDWRDRSPYGASSTNALNTAHGTETHVLTTAEMPVHSHGLLDSGHSHGQQINGGAGYKQQTGTGRIAFGVLSTVSTNRENTDSATTGMSMTTTGSSAPHSNFHPVININYIVKAD